MALARSGGSGASLCGRDRNEADRCCVSRPIFWNSRCRGMFGDAERKSELSQGRLDSGLDSLLPESMVIALFAVLFGRPDQTPWAAVDPLAGSTCLSQHCSAPVRGSDILRFSAARV